MAKINSVETLNTKQGARKFRVAAGKYTERVVKSKSEARKALVSLGIITKSGKLTDKYK